MPYLLDADVFIRAKNLDYGFDFCPAFWDWLIAGNDAGRVFSIEKVGDEIQAVADDLSVGRGAGRRVLPPARCSGVSRPGNRQHLGQHQGIRGRGREHLPYLVAQAQAGEHTIVTHEVPSASTRKIKIPDACIGLGIKCMTPYEMLRRERARFVLGAHP